MTISSLALQIYRFGRILSFTWRNIIACPLALGLKTSPAKSQKNQYRYSRVNQAA